MEDKKGFIMLPRAMAEDDDYLAEPLCKSAARTDLLILANYKPSILRIRGNEIKVEIGQVAWSEEALAKRWKWSRGKVRRFLKNEEKKGKIVQQKTPSITLITILCGCKELRSSTTDGTTDSTTDSTTDGTTDSTTDSTADGTHPNKVIKKERKKENITFDVFWDLYGYKKSKAKAEPKWKNLTDAERAKIIETLPAFLKEHPNTKYRPHPITYLNGKRWEDELAPLTAKELSKERSRTGAITEEPHVPIAQPESLKNQM